MNKNLAFRVVLCLPFFYTSCKPKKNDVFHAIDFIKAQVANVDTSIYSIIKLVPESDSTYDTTYVKREEFNGLARDFLETPDISKTFPGKYTEQRMMNNDLGLAVFIATPKDGDLEVRRQEVRIEPGPRDDDGATNDKIKSIYIERVKNRGDSSIIKRMTWDANRKFQIVTITQKGNEPEKTSVLEVIWNDQEKD